ncbi:DUF927 domain-containing protein [Geobacter argillaceus]|uniref:Uncharacterized protein (DUF927 family) n=1 Tax=Geobacter argillaceus TaxID=345631 RepID=A0A562V7F3_9BACT|nr:DUF927 domain-containing protein [Geobacter argillaceus]TWJ13667.1 uncharacterized protein (DUF927 family) [Geobacter argillaceus]
MEFNGTLQDEDITPNGDAAPRSEAAIEDGIVTDGDSSKQDAKLPASAAAAHTDEQLVETMGGSETFVLMWQAKKPGLYARVTKKVDDKMKTYDVFVSAPVRVIGLVRDIHNTSWGRLISFTDMDGHEHSPIIKMEDLGRNGEKIIADLRSMGLFVLPDPTSLNRLIAYINNAIPEKDRRIRCTDKYGWHENVFVMPGHHIGTGEEEFLYQSSSAKLQAYSVKGTLDGWREHVALPCRGNSRLIFSVSMAFAAPLLNIAEIENGGFHLYGNSSIGKSTSLYLAASVIGNPDATIQKWNATINAMEATAKHYNDALLPMDEIGQSDPKQIGDTTYMLGNGSGKARADSRGEARKRASFRNLFLSNGEKTLSDHMGEIGKKVRVGQEVRLVDLPADPGAGLGLFETLHGFESGAKFADQLKRNTSEYHGTPFVAFIEAMVRRKDSLANEIHEYISRFCKGVILGDASGQVQRVATRFALIAFGGLMATQEGITGWEEADAGEAAVKCFQQWLEHRGGSGILEETKIINQVRAYFEQYGASRFVPCGYRDKTLTAMEQEFNINQRAGVRVEYNSDKDSCFFVFPEVFREVICAGYNPTSVAKLLAERGMLKKSSEGKLQCNFRIPGIGQKKIYYITSKILTDG